MSPLDHLASLIPLFAGLIWAAAEDIRERKIRNVTNAVIALGGAVTWSYANGLGGLGTSLIGLAAALAIGVLLYVIRVPGMGRFFAAGDAKLLAAIGAWTGVYPLGKVLLATALAGGVVGLVNIKLAGGAAKIRALPPEERPKAAKVPYGVALVTGTILTLAWENGVSWLQ